MGVAAVAQQPPPLRPPFPISSKALKSHRLLVPQNSSLAATGFVSWSTKTHYSRLVRGAVFIDITVGLVSRQFGRQPSLEYPARRTTTAKKSGRQSGFPTLKNSSWCLRVCGLPATGIFCFIKNLISSFWSLFHNNDDVKIVKVLDTTCIPWSAWLLSHDIIYQGCFLGTMFQYRY